MTDDPETQQVQAFIDAGHPRMALAVVVLRRLLSVDRKVTAGRILGWGGGVTGAIVIIQQAVNAFLR